MAFVDSQQNKILVSVDNILYNGYPIDAETGDDLELVSNQLLYIDQGEVQPPAKKL